MSEAARNIAPPPSPAERSGPPGARTSTTTRALLVGGAAVAATAALVHLGILGWIFAGRIGYPFDLEWMEGGMLCHALRVLEKRPIYAPPSADFISYLYTPFYPMLVAGLGKIFGLGYTLGRVVSILGFLLALGAAFLAVRRQSGGGLVGSLLGVAALGVAASTFPFTGAWYDLVRNDSLYLGLTTSALYLLAYHRRSFSALVVAGVLLGLAYLTKQTASLFIVFSGLALLVLDWRRLPVLVTVVGAVAGGSALLLNWQTKGWFWKYTYEMHQGHDLYKDRLWPVTEQKLLGFFPVVGALLGIWLLGALVRTVARPLLRRRDERSRALDGIASGSEASTNPRLVFYWFAVALTGILVSAVGFATQWASENAYIPGLFFPGLFVAMATGDLARRARVATHAPSRIFFTLGALLFALALAGQMIVQRYSPSKHLPRPGDVRRGRELVTLLERIDGPVMMPYHPFYPVLAGKRPSYPQMGINDVTRAGYPFPLDIVARIARHHYRAVLFDNPPRGRYDFVLEHYKLGRYFEGDEVPLVVAGYAVRPTFLLVPKEPEPAPAGTRRIFGFEGGTYEGWTVEGAAWGERPATGPLWDQGPVGPFEGSYFASSYQGGDGSKGSLRSPEFLVDKPILTYRVGGGRNPVELEVRLIVDGDTVYSGTGPGTDLFEERRVDVRAHLGKKMVLELVDRATGPWGHLLFDDLMLRDR